jgi:hypothetical protein
MLNGCGLFLHPFLFVVGHDVERFDEQIQVVEDYGAPILLVGLDEPVGIEILDNPQDVSNVLWNKNYMVHVVYCYLLAL